MPQTDFLPTRDIDLRNWVTHFAAKIFADPVAWGIAPPAAANLLALAGAFASALSAVSNPGTRTVVTIAEKQTAKAALRAAARDAARIIRANPAISADQRVGLGLSLADEILTPAAAPLGRPMLSLIAREARRHIIRIGDADAPTHRRKPLDAAGALMFVSFGDAPPANLSHCRFCGIATRETFAVEYEAQDTGLRAHIMAVWFNRKGATGPMSERVSATVAA